MELKEGMYVRLDTGKIGKIIYFKKRDSYPYSYDRITLDSERYNRTTRNVIKASNNIIDLIEVGDYVNGSEVLDFENKYVKENDEFVRFGVITENCYLENTDSWIIEKDIKSIVTKEHFKTFSYRVEE